MVTSTSDLVAIIDDGLCHAACLFGSDEENGKCGCRCAGEFHGAARKFEGTAVAAVAPPVGWWFHSWTPIADDDPMNAYTVTKVLHGVRCARQWQGQVLSMLGERYMVQLYSWADGAPHDAILVTHGDLDQFTFYLTNDDMRMAGGCEEWMTKRRDGFDGLCGNQKVGYVEVNRFGRQYLCGPCMDHWSGKRVYL